MPLNSNYEYEPSKEFEISLKRWISKYLSLHTDDCTQKEYEKILDILSKIEDNFYEQIYLPINDPNLTFEQKRDMKAEALKQFALPKILIKLCELQQKRNKNNFNEENLDWTKCETNVNEIVKMIWKIWCHEREHRPRAGIIFLYLDTLGVAEVLLTKYIKNNYIQYGYAKGKMEFGGTIWDCAAREAAEELGLDAKIIYNQIQNSSPIRKYVFNVVDKSLIEHYYFIIPVESKNINLKPNRKEIHSVEWHDVYTLPCCNNCQMKQPIQSTDSLRESNYFMVMCTDRNGHNSLVGDILIYMDKINKNQLASQKYANMHKLCRHNK